MSKFDNKKENLLELIKKEKILLLNKLANDLNISYTTAKKYISFLEDKKIVSLVNGVVVYNGENIQNNIYDYSVTSAEKVHTEEKERIGKKAASLITDNDSIILDTGSTCGFIARNISDNLKLTILCYTLTALMHVCNKPDNTIIFAGGYFHENSKMFECPEAVTLINRNRATKAFIAASGISLDLGVTCENNYELPTKRAVINSAQQKILVADSSKFGRVRSTYFAEVSEFDIIITDDGIQDEYRDYFAANNIPLIIC
ncbi:DeoR/GlpR transcriptional regulator [Treponema sp. OMZ 840]|uniref:DeoR/GlpR family DNA-binding transcription regulator n=1 Tax=Treponema sp. OMZ 840 TaxID=244313 RepID=UPI003D8FA95F